MSDLDEDLLALAGAGGDDDSGPRASRKRAASKRQQTAKRRRRAAYVDSDDDLGSTSGGDEDDEDENIDEDERDIAIAGRGVRRRRGKSEDEDEDSGEENLDEAFTNPYPLEGKYKNEEDMAWLESMDELERERILFDRSQEMQRFTEREYLAKRLQEQRRASKDKSKTSTRSSTRDTPKGTTTKRAQLSELKKKREAKSFRSRQRSDNSDYGPTRLQYDEDDEDDESQEAEEKDELVWADAPTLTSQDITVHDINAVRIGRTLLSKYCHYPEFDRFATDCFVRINIGFNKEKQIEIYRVCQIKGLIDSRTYTFLNRTVNQNLVVTHAAAERSFEMSICSDKPFTEEEFETWKRAMKKENLPLPTKRLLDGKFAQLQKMREHVLSADEVNAMIELRQKLTANMPSNSLMQKTMLNQKRLIALTNDDLETVADIDAKIAAIDEQQESRHTSAVMDSPLQRLVKVNERNRRTNQDEIRRAEIRASEERRKASKSAVTSNPFSRLKTNPRMYYDSSAAEDTANETQDTLSIDITDSIIRTNGDATKTTEVTGATAKQGANAIDDIIASTNFGIDIDLEI
ncbi:uncharacterized protein V1518DRAFT_369958 [Limtongia smithiae]|uniref:uncharacterized protein n=1 Tax=Limtongia smithiae TaxID=1125753 RepID=UPI0034CFA22E